MPELWKTLLNFGIPFFAEALLCIFTSLLKPSIVHQKVCETKQDPQFPSLSEIAVHSGNKEFKTDVTSPILPSGFGEDPTLRSHRSWPILNTQASSKPHNFIRMHTNSLCMFPLEEMIPMDEDMDGEALLNIRPLPKESARKPYRKSLGCVSDLHGRQAIRMANMERLQVFNNGLYLGESPFGFSPME